MARVTLKRDELSVRINKLEQMLSIDMKPSDLVARVEEVIEPEDEKETWEHDEAVFNLPKAGVLRDAWIVGKFAELAGADCARLSGDQWPDGVVTIRGRQHNVEATEAQMPGRRRGDEYRADRPRVGDGGPRAWDRVEAAVPGVLANAILKKAAKNYSEPSLLVVLLTIPDYGARHAEIEAHIGNCHFDQRSRFEAVYIIWKNKLYQLDAAGFGK